MITLIAFDLESTGRKVQEDQIIQIGAVSACFSRDVSSCTNIKTFCEFVKCTNSICSESIAVTGITNEMVKDASPLMDVLERFSNFIVSSQDPQWERVLIAYRGTDFDIPLLVHELRRNNVMDVVSFLRKWKVTYFYDPFPVAKKVLDATQLPMNDRGLPCYKLTSLFKTFFKQDLEHAHDALADSKGLLQLVSELEPMRIALAADIQLAHPDFLPNLLTIAQQIRVCKRPIQGPISFQNQMKKPKFAREFLVFEPWFTFLQTGQKSIEGRRGTLAEFDHLVGQDIQFRNEQISFFKHVTEIKHYDDIEAFVRDSPLEDTLPGITTTEDACAVYYQFWSREKVQESGGMIAMYLK
jgi:DNA polymerase III epsilon subunit-like protein/ASC-1-like (ASCH) protein